MSKWVVAVVPILLGATLAVQVQAAQPSSGPQTSGYIDVQHQWGRGDLNLNGAQHALGVANSFRVNQGAVMLASEFDIAEAYIDIPFRQSTSVGDLGNDLELATREAQAYVKYQYDSGINWQFGQFDSIFGFEGNDSSDILFPTHGILHSFTPSTHLGVGVGYQFLPFFLQAYFGNSGGVGAQHRDETPEIGVKLGWSQEPVQLSIGALVSKTQGKYGLNTFLNEASYQPRVLINSVAQAHVGKLDLAAEIDISQSRLSKAYIGGQVVNHDLVYGMLVQGSYLVADKWTAAVRYEYMKNDETNEYVSLVQNALDNPTPLGSTLTGQGGFYSKMSIAVKRTISEELVVKAGLDVFALNIGKDAAGKTNGWNTAELALVYDF